MKLIPQGMCTIDIQELFTAKKADYEALSNSVIRQLKVIKIDSLPFDEDFKNWLECETAEIVDHFEFLRDLVNGEIPNSEWSSYDFDGNFQSMFNGYLEELYNLGDTKPVDIDGNTRKLFWVKTRI
jgi:hypothetical protein